MREMSSVASLDLPMCKCHTLLVVVKAVLSGSFWGPKEPAKLLGTSKPAAAAGLFLAAAAAGFLIELEVGAAAAGFLIELGPASTRASSGSSLATGDSSMGRVGAGDTSPESGFAAGRFRHAALEGLSFR